MSEELSGVFEPTDTGVQELTVAKECSALDIEGRGRWTDATLTEDQ